MKRLENIEWQRTREHDFSKPSDDRLKYTVKRMARQTSFRYV